MIATGSRYRFHACVRAASPCNTLRANANGLNVHQRFISGVAAMQVVRIESETVVKKAIARHVVVEASSTQNAAFEAEDSRASFSCD